MTREQKTRAWDFYKHADNLLASRLGYVMVAQSMLLTAFATVFSSATSAQSTIVQLVISLFGIWLSYIQYLLSRSLVAKLDAMKAILIKDTVARVWFNSKPGRPRGLQSRYVPFALFLVWTLLLMISFVKF